MKNCNSKRDKDNPVSMKVFVLLALYPTNTIFVFSTIIVLIKICFTFIITPYTTVFCFSNSN